MLKNKNMRKNGSRLISFAQYRLIDLIMFAIILGVAELLVFVASRLWFKGDAYYYVSFLLPITLIMLIRWGVWGIGHILLSGVLTAVLYDGKWMGYISYPLGYLSLLFLLIPLKFFGIEKIKIKWYYTTLLITVAWLLVNLTSAVVYGIFDNNVLAHLIANFGFGSNGLLSLMAAILVIFITRKFDGLLEYQKNYLLRLDKERKEAQYANEFGEKPIEIDEESLDIILDRDSKK